MSDWVVEAVIQFVKSPLWSAPVNNFIDDQCIIFADDDSEMKHEYTTVFHAFQHLIDSLLTTFIEELGVPAEEVIAACKKRMVAEQSASRDKFVTEFMEYITCLDDFRSFKKVMEQRNVALELEAAKAYRQHTKAEQAAASTNPAPSSNQAVESDEDRELRLAIEASLAEDAVRQRKAELDDAELQKALALSIALEEERAQARKEYLEECSRRAAEREEAQRIAQEHALVEAQKQANIQAMEAATLAQRKENCIQLATAPPVSDSPVEVPPPAPQVELPVAPVAPVKATVAEEPVQCLAPMVMPKAPEYDVVRVSSTEVVASQPSSSLAPIGSRKAAFSSFKTLPSIASQQPTFRELKQEMLGGSVSSDPVKPTLQAAPSQVFVNNQAPSAQQVEERARQMRELRERIAATKKAERETELQNFKNAMGDTAAPASTPQATVDSTKQLTVEIARRFREDLIGETRRQ